jgi:hypothetical protein
METTTYKAVRTAWGWDVQAHAPNQPIRCVVSMSRYTGEDYARRFAALLNVGAHLSIEALESGRFELVEKVTA